MQLIYIEKKVLVYHNLGRGEAEAPPYWCTFGILQLTK